MSDRRDDDPVAGRGPAEAKPEAEPVETVVRNRQKSRARVMAFLLGAFVILIFAISIVKMTPGVAQ